MFDVGSAVGYLLLDTSNFKNGFTSALKDLNTFRSETATASDKMAALGSAMTSAGKTLTKSVTLPLVGIGTAATNTAAKFEKGMSQVQATLGIAKDAMSELNGESVNVMDALSDLAKQLGAETKFSASEAADAINNMAMAGYSVQEIYESLPQVLALASAGSLDLDYATQLVANGLNVMGMEASDAQELADKLAVTASNAYGSVSDFGEGLLVAGAQAKLANVSLTDTATALGILGDAGISASEGGTYLRNTLKNLYTPTSEAATQLEALGIKTQEDDGTIRDFQTVLQELGVALDGLTEGERITAMSKIFDTRTISAANALIEQSGERWDELSGKIDGASGAAQQMADTQLDNLNGQLTILKSALEGAGIAFGELLLPLIKDVTSFIQKLVDKINGLNDNQKAAVVRIAEVVAVAGPLLTLLGKMFTTLSKLPAIITTVKTVFGALNAVLSANPVGLVITAIGLLVTAFITLWNKCEGFRNFWINLWEGIKNAFNSAFGWISSGIEKLSNLIDRFKSKSSSIQGSYASGLDYVPSDMTVRVHEGEAILTKEQNANGGGSSAGVFNLLSSALPQIISGLDKDIVLDDGTLVGRTSPKTDVALENVSNLRGRGLSLA